MNTFIVKSNKQLKGGQYIGLSNIDCQYVFIYRSHKVFKDANPNLKPKDFTIIDDFKRKDFDFRKYNVCPVCGGLKVWYNVACDKPMNGKVLYDEDGFVLFSEEICVNCICDNGTYVGYLEHELRMAERNAKESIEEISEKLFSLELYVMERSTCKTCGGNREKMYSYEKCEECGLPGTRIFLAGG
jgi:hypothetical protein